jgi:hypothetical protein
MSKETYVEDVKAMQAPVPLMNRLRVYIGRPVAVYLRSVHGTIEPVMDIPPYMPPMEKRPSSPPAPPRASSVDEESESMRRPGYPGYGPGHDRCPGYPGYGPDHRHGPCPPGHEPDYGPPCPCPGFPMEMIPTAVVVGTLMEAGPDFIELSSPVGAADAYPVLIPLMAVGAIVAQLS